jgi:aryl-alcohol dehydrogenase-like predicted oxidoreductase
MPGAGAPFAESLGAMFDMQKQGKILHVGVSNVSRAELETALAMGPIATVENMYGHGQRTTLKTPHGENRGGQEVLDICEANHIPLVPYFSLLNSLPKHETRVAAIARKYKATEAQINIAWLLHRSPWILPIPGTSQLAHLEENIQAAAIELTEDDMGYLE